MSRITSPSIDEASGVCASRIHTGVLYTHNDSGHTNRIFAFSSSTGTLLATITIAGARSVDWEDIACGPCTGGSGHCIYIADTGNTIGSSENTIYRIREPAQLYDRTVTLDSKLMFSWDQSEANIVMADPHGEVYVVSKVPVGMHAKVVHLPSSAWGKSSRTYVNGGVHLTITSNRHGPVGGDIAPHGRAVLIKTYGHVYYWDVSDGNYYAHLQQQPQTVPYIVEPFGEAVCFDASGRGYYTIGEGDFPPLYYYKNMNAFSVVG